MRGPDDSSSAEGREENLPWPEGLSRREESDPGPPGLSRREESAPGPPALSRRAVLAEERATRRYVREVVARTRVAERDLDDVVQEVMFAAARSAHRFRVPEGCTPEEARRAWLRGIVERRVAYHRRQQARLRNIDLRAEPPGGDWHGPGAAPDAESVALARAGVAALEEGLAALLETAPALHAVVVAHTLEERAMERVAAEVGVRVNTAWNRLRLGKKALRALLRREGSPPAVTVCAWMDPAAAPANRRAGKERPATSRRESGGRQ